MSTATRAQSGELSLPEMMRIMDVATAIRQDRELVEEQLNLDALKERLRDRMIAAAKVTGEEVTPAEVDAAIDQYYRSMYTFHEPPWSFSVALAHLWVRRDPILRRGAVAMIGIALFWWLFLSRSGPLTLTGGNHRSAQKLAVEVSKLIESSRSVAIDPETKAEIERLKNENETYGNQDDTVRLKALRARLTDLNRRLLEEYTVSVVSRAREKERDRSIFSGSPGRKVSGFYLIVEAKTADGKILSRRIHNSENDRDEEVSTWGERVPTEVYERLKKDKQEDGILNETAFAVKRRGYAEEEIKMTGADGRPLTRNGQITKW